MTEQNTTPDAPKKTVQKGDTVDVVTLIPVYPQVGRRPWPVGTKMTVPKYRADLWVARKIARVARDGEQPAPNTLQAASMPPAPDMKAPPATQG